MKQKNNTRKAKLIIKENGAISGESDTAALAMIYLNRDRYTSKMKMAPFCG
jgi:hypothetical protein